MNVSSGIPHTSPRRRAHSMVHYITVGDNCARPPARTVWREPRSIVVANGARNPKHSMRDRAPTKQRSILGRPMRLLSVPLGSALALTTFAVAAAFAGPPKRTLRAPSDTIAPAPAAARLDYDRDIRPIISDACFKCHGFDERQRQAGLRLDTQAGAYAKRASGRAAVAPGHPELSEVYRRISDTGPLHMPPAGSGKTIKPAQAALIKQWIAQGGVYKQHWSFVPPVRPALPAVRQAAWVRNPIDRFILARLEKEGLKPSPEAGRATLLRRLSFDLTGLPPTPQELDAFVADKSPDAYEKQVDRLLASPHYGERMALQWLDLARYADTHGYHIDSQREMWRWREWVIDAYNKNKPNDQFTIEQLAGDLLPSATLDQKLATGFNRNHPINFEGGAIPEEYQAAYIFDRIDTTATTWMGLTMRCGQCHTHKYDPITQRDYYRFYAFFNSIAENGLDGQKGNAAPFMRAPEPEQQVALDRAAKTVADAERTLRDRAAEAAPGLPAWEQRQRASVGASPAVEAGLLANYTFDEGAGGEAKEAQGRLKPAAIKGKPQFGAGKFGGALLLDGATHAEIGTDVAFDRTDKFSYGAWIYPTDAGAMTVVSRMDDPNMFRGWDLYLGDRRAFVHLIHSWEGNAIRVNTKSQFELNRWTHLFVTYDGSSKAKGIHIYVNGKAADLDITHDALTDTIKTPVAARIGSRNGNAFFRGSIDDVRIYGRELSAAEVAQIAGSDGVRELLAIAPEKRTAEQKQALLTAYLTSEDAVYRQRASALADAKKRYADIDAAIPTSMVMQEMDKPRDTFMLIRGQYDRKGDKVEPGHPEFLTETMSSPSSGASTANSRAPKGWYTRAGAAEGPLANTFTSSPAEGLLATKLTSSPAAPDSSADSATLSRELGGPTSRPSSSLTADGRAASRTRPAGARSAALAVGPPTSPAQTPAQAQPRLTRLDLARWLVRPDHPLTSRVAVNRYWQLIFGTGLVKTAEDFGTQGERPSHPELLDWLATEFVRSGWNTKAMIRLLVTSGAY